MRESVETTAVLNEDESATDASPATDVVREAATESLTAEVLSRYLATAVADREAAEERSSKVITRFTKLTIAMMCLTTVVAGANLAMILRESNLAQPTATVLPRPTETLPIVAQPVQTVLPTPPPPAAQELAPPAEKVPLLGSPPAEKIPLLGSPPSEKMRLLGSPRSTKDIQPPAPVRVARPTIAPPRTHPLLSARTGEDEDDSRKSGPVERW